MDAARLEAQLLAGPPAAGVLDVVERLLAVQSQDLRAARLAVRSRTRGLAASDVDRAFDDRSLVVTWLNRGTLHMVRAEDYPWLHALTAPRSVTGNLRRLGQEGVPPADAERAVAEVVRALGDEGPLTRDRLRDRLDAIGVRTAGQAIVHVLVRASLLGLIVRGPIVGGDQAYVLVRDWLGEPPAVDRDAALAELARRYLAGHGPADERDLARWAGLGLREARAGLRASAGAFQPRDGGSAPPPRLLGGFDPVLFGWVDRTPLLGDNQGVVTLNGIFRPIALVKGRAAATWTMPRGEVELAPFGRIAKADRDALAADADDVRRFLAN